MENLGLKIREKLAELHDEFEAGVEERRKRFQYTLTQGRIVFAQEVAARHRLLRMKLLKFLSGTKIAVIVTAPIIYSLIIPVVLMDLFVTVYQQVCFRIYRIPRVRRGDFVVMDRKYLGYLNVIEKINCVYCEYANGVISYAREVASQTEHFWCPIKHAKKTRGMPERYYDYLEYGDGDDFRHKLLEHREKCRACEAPCVKKD